MNANEYKKLLLKRIEAEQDKISELDHTGNLWWSTFRKFVNDFEPVTKDPIDFDGLVGLINKTFDRQFRKMTSSVKSKYRARIKDGYTKEDIFRAIMAVKENQWHIDSDFDYCTPTFFSQEKTLEKYGVKKGSNSKSINDNSPVN